MEIINVGPEPRRGVENINKLGGARRPGPRCPWCVRDIHNPGPGSWQILIIGAFSILYTVGYQLQCGHGGDTRHYPALAPSDLCLIKLFETSS